MVADTLSGCQIRTGVRNEVAIRPDSCPYFESPFGERTDPAIIELKNKILTALLTAAVKARSAITLRHFISFLRGKRSGFF